MSFFKDYNPDYFYLSLGGGVQSSALAEMIAIGSLPAPDAVFFADTGDEPAYVYQQIEYLTSRLAGVTPVNIIKGGHILDDIYNGARFAAMPLFTDLRGKRGRMKRQCTAEYKVRPILKAVKKELLERGMAHRDGRGLVVHKGLAIHGWLGISLDEYQRMKPSPDWWVNNRWPLVDLEMTRQDCVIWLTDHDLPVPLKSSCMICPYHNDDYYRWIKEARPDDWEHIVQFDHDLRDGAKLKLAATARAQLFMHRDLIPLDQVDFRTAIEKGQLPLFSAYDDEFCESGHCFM